MNLVGAPETGSPQALFELFSDRARPTQLAVVRFAYDHLSEEAKKISRQCANLAITMTGSLPDSPDLTNGLWKLWEAKNHFVYLEVGGRRFHQ